jgi:hypothetical protein
MNMRNLLIISSCLIFAFDGFCWTKIEKYNGGFFGYKVVYEEHSGPNHMLGCADPGKKSCTWAGIVSTSDGEATEEQLKEIDDMVLRKILSNDLEGTFYYSSNFYVHYSYNVDLDKLNFEVYNLNEAHELGLI